MFKHCDPARIVFYPRYFEMINDAVETMFVELFDWPFERLHVNQAVPTANVTVDFKAPSRHGDRLEFDISLLRIGGSSLGLEMHVQCEGETRMLVSQVLVLVNEAGRPIKWPDPFREKVNKVMEEAA